jgi:hypothetical protein
MIDGDADHIRVHPGSGTLWNTPGTTAIAVGARRPSASPD